MSNDRSSESQSSESFAALFEAEERGNPRRARRGYSVGEAVDAKVVRIGKDAVFVALDGKQEGFIELPELLDDAGKVTVGVGDTVRATVIRADDVEGQIRLAIHAPKGRGAEGLMRAKDAQMPVEGVVTGVNKGGLEVDVGGVRAFCPTRAVDVRFVQDPGSFVGQKLKFLVASVKDGGRDVTLSRRALLEREGEEARTKIAERLVVGGVLRGKVTSTREFGAFVDLGGVEGLLPTSELSHDRSVRAEDVLKVGDEIDVQLLKMEPDPKRPGAQKITLSLKALAGDPWESLAPSLKEGDVRDGKVARAAQFGVFVQIAPGLDGLLHVSELGEQAAPKPGESISVRVLKVDLAARRISLARSDAPVGGVKAARAAASASIVRENAIVKGTVSRIEPYGVFLAITGTNTRGLVSAQELQRVKAGDLHKTFPIGTELEAKVVSIDAAGKVRLSIEAKKNDEERASFEDYRAKEQERSSGKLGALGEKLKLAGVLAGGGKKKK